MPRDTTVEDQLIDLLKEAKKLVKKLSKLVDLAIEENED